MDKIQNSIQTNNLETYFKKTRTDKVEDQPDKVETNKDTNKVATKNNATKIEISDVGKDFARIKRVAQLPLSGERKVEPNNSKRIEQLKQAIEQKTYAINYDKLLDNLLQAGNK